MGEVATIEAVKDAGKFVRRDSEAGVGNGQLGIAVVTGEMNADAAFGLVVLDGIVSEIQEKLLQAVAIASYDDRIALEQLDLNMSRPGRASR